MLLIEGPDMVGKTTLAHKVVDALRRMGEPAGYFKFGMESRGRMSATYLLGRIHGWTVYDRMHWSESIYAVATGQQPSLHAEEMIKVEKAFFEAGGLLVLVTSPPEAYRSIAARTHGRGEDFSVDTCRLVNGLYRTAAEKGELPTLGGGWADVRKPDFHLEVQVDGEGEPWWVDDAKAQEIAGLYAIHQARRP